MKSKNNLAVFTQDSHASVSELGNGYFIYKTAKLSRGKLGDLVGNWFSVHESKEDNSVVAGKIIGFEFDEVRQQELKTSAWVVNIVFKRVPTISVAGNLLEWGHDKCYHDLTGSMETEWFSDEADHGVKIICEQVTNPPYTSKANPAMWEQFLLKSIDSVSENGTILMTVPVRSGKSQIIKDIMNNAKVKEKNISVLITNTPMSDNI